MNKPRKGIARVQAMLLGLLLMSGAFAANPYQVGDAVINPLTGEAEIVQHVVGDTVFTDHGNGIYVGTTTVGDFIPDPRDPEATVQITAVHVNATTNLVDEITVSGIPTPIAVVTADVDDSAYTNREGADGTPEREDPVVIPPGDNSNIFVMKRIGADGHEGDNGWGIEICIIWCFTIGENAERGGDGFEGPAINATVDTGPIVSAETSPILPGVWVASIGGNGGRGGDAYVSLGIEGEQGGKAGKGGKVNVTSNVEITTWGNYSHGIFAQSRAGRGGDGGDAFAADPGSGGPAAESGEANVTNNGDITTYGDGADGVLVQAIGGSGGSGGDAYGLVGRGGTASQGGHGGTASATNNGSITTRGTAAHGMVVQSIGGDGGDAGLAIAISAVGGAGDFGGDGRAASATNETNATITTYEKGSYGLLVQSIGGGGGNGGTGGGLVGVGGQGAGGGSGGEVTVTNKGLIVTYSDDSHAIVAQSIGGGGGTGGVGAGIGAIGGGAGSGSGHGNKVTVSTAAGSEIFTEGVASSGVLAQSIGGGGGAAGSSGGLVAVGGAAGGAGNGGEVIVNSAGLIHTIGVDAKGIVAQSIGGGGGSANPSGGLVSLGGQGGAGGEGKKVDVTNAGSIITTGQGAAGVLAQSIGGGGGNGGSSGGLVSLGGAGTSGGKSGEVIVTNEGLIATSGARAQGVLAQSIGGGGGTGGDSGGLVSFGGSGSIASSGGVVQVTNKGVIETGGNQSSAIEAMSIGGGGGNGGTSGAVAFSLGGKAGGGGDGNTVMVTNDHNLHTQGNDSHGIFAQSVGGGGGNGGNSASVSAFAGVAIGGSGGSGGKGESVTIHSNKRTVQIGGQDVEVAPLIETQGDRAKGIFAQSVGGGGGNGGMAAQVSVGYGASVSVAVGGSGGNGGDGGRVELTGDSTIITDGFDSDGILAQSVGGGGGNGGFALSFAGAVGDAGALAVSVGGGGAGGGGGVGKEVVLNAGGNIHTKGEKSEGLIAQSIGGGGGTGGFSVSLSAAGAGGTAGSVSVSVGGSGGDGGNSGKVDATYKGTVVTEKDDSNAILFQSVGGGGGNGGFSVSGAVTGAGGGTLGVAVGVGGSGGGGGDGGEVIGRMTGGAGTMGDRSLGVVAQSIGGGGGNGGLNASGAITASGAVGGSVSVGVGGSGGGGGKGEKATLILTGDVETQGDYSGGVLAQSVGGGGGNGGLNVSGGVTVAGAGAGTIGVGVGGAGGGGGKGGEASATVTGDVITHGANAHAITAQSVGGGGGNGGLNVTGALSAAKSGAGTLAVGVGGYGGAGGEGGAVSGVVQGNTQTAGDNSYGVLLQSVGGGGGNGGLNVSGTVSLAGHTSGTAAIGVGGFGGAGGKASTVFGDVAGDVSTLGDKAFGVLAQSVGGGGGNGGVNVSGSVQLSNDGAAAGAIGVGGFGATGGNSDRVTLTRSGRTTTDGANADGVVAQSIGGGGGNGGINISSGITASSGGSAFSAAIGIGGFGGGAGNAGDVIATVNGDVLATGLESDAFETEDGVTRRVRKGGSNGILAQSLGGAGGNGGINVSAGISVAAPMAGQSQQSNSLTIGLGGFGGDGGDAGAVTLTVNANEVRSVGDQRFAIGAQSIGGGGGNGGMNVSGGVATDGALTVGLGGFGGDGGLGKAVTATANANVFASGAGAIGFLAQSVGGGGGNGGVNVSGGLQAQSAGKKPTLAVGLGGFGGEGNRSDAVVATQRGRVSVEGADAIGVLAQSVAGGGGNGGFNFSGSLSEGKGSHAAIGIGGNGGKGADAGTVHLTSDGEILVDGREPLSPDEPTEEEEREKLNYRERANGILAQSIGGGGGNGGANITGVAAPFGNPFAVGVGGTGAGGGHAGAVTVNRGLNEASLLRTWGNAANGITVQSIGGGGGNAGVNVVVEGTGAEQGEPDPSKKPSNNKQAMVVIGGSGGDAGDGNTVNVTHVGDIITDGRQSDGIVAQSIGGGGGNANVNFGAGINKNTSGLDLVIGGGPKDGGSGKAVTVQHTGNIGTQGNDATAIFAQSVGGGGGNAEADDSQVADLLAAPDIILDVFSPDPKSSTNITIGRKGGTGGTGGDVSVSSNGTLQTMGERAVGIRAQSVGNAGGVSGTTNVGYAAKTEWSMQVGLEGGEGGRSGAVAVTSAGAIYTAGNSAHAIHAQSVGGGGGVGGAVTSELIQNQNGASIGLGGTGGKGGEGGAVNVDNSALLVTLGDQAHGIYAQSIGGGGGDGGYAGITASQAASAAVELLNNLLTKEKAAESSTSLNVLTGGSGGEGAKGHSVTVTNSGAIVTQGRKSHGVNAQSIGGGGGTGGMVVNGTVAGGGSSKSLAINVGGSGGEGGTGAAVLVENEGTIHTIGDESVGIRAQSVGGGGGDAGLLANINIAPVKAEATATSVDVNVGGFGGEGASSDSVTVTNRRSADGTGGDILTEGRSAHGILAQSLGGGGGNGSSIVSLGLSGGEGVTRGGLNIGGEGGTGNKAGNVTVTNNGAIETRGDTAHGVFAQSVGGGGGNGGLVLAAQGAFAASGGTHTPLVSLGGGGGTGDDAGDVTVENSGTILTRGQNAHGVFAQSIGGGGGNAGIGLGLTSSPQSTRVAGLLSALFGGNAGKGGRGGEVRVTHSGDITVLGNNSRAVVAESINGGGGHIALDFHGIASLPGGAALPGEPAGTDLKPLFKFGGGGVEQEQSNAGRVVLNYTGTFGAAGRNGAANSVQAIGGGGGTFDLNLSFRDADTAAEDRARFQGTLGATNGRDNDGGDIDGTHAGNLVTEGANTFGLMLQSIGGGGGRASLDVTTESGAVGDSAFVLGGTGGVNERGGRIQHAQAGNIVTSGAAAHGATLQSIGGGGGTLTFMMETADPGVAQASASRAKIAAAAVADSTLNLSLGSTGGSQLDGAAVALQLAGATSTQGDLATGLTVQSIGGGGGTATVLGTGTLDVAIGGTAGASGNGGDVQLDYDGGVATAGLRSHGVFLQSIGGGGAAVFTDASIANVTLSSDNVGNGGAIRFTQTGDIVTTGRESFGLFAQSVGGGGGFVDGAFAGSAGGAGAGGAIDLTLGGDVVTMGELSTALFAQSAGTTGGDIRIRLAEGLHIIGSRAVVIDGGADNLFENRGSVMTHSGVTGAAITAGRGNDAIINQGSVAGNVDLGEGTNRFVNRAGASFYSGSTVNLGAPGNLLVQEGLLAPGATGRAEIVSLWGSLQQTSTGASNLELDFATDTADSVLATGTVELAGTTRIELLNTHAIKPGEQSQVLYSGAAGLTDNGLEVITPPSLVISYDVQTSNANTLALGYDVDFAVNGVKGNRIAIGDYINRVQAAGSSPLLADTIRTLVMQAELQAYADLLTQLGSEFYAEQQVSTLRSAQSFARSMQDCGALNVGRIENAGVGCLWGRYEVDSTQRSEDEGFPGAEETARRYSHGFQRSAGEWIIGAGIAFEDNDAHGFGGNWRAETTVIQGGLQLRRTFGPTSAGAMLTLGNSDQEVQRRLFVTDSELLRGQRDVTFASGIFDVTHHIHLGQLTVTPAMNLGFASLSGDTLTEAGAFGQGATLARSTQTHTWIEPSLAFAWQTELPNRQWFRAYARFSALEYLTKPHMEVRAGFASAPLDVAPMTIVSELDRTHYAAEAGMEFVADRLVLSFAYATDQSHLRDSNMGSLRFRIPLH